MFKCVATFCLKNDIIMVWRMYRNTWDTFIICSLLWMGCGCLLYYVSNDCKYICFLRNVIAVERHHIAEILLKLALNTSQSILIVDYITYQLTVVCLIWYPFIANIWYFNIENISRLFWDLLLHDIKRRGPRAPLTDLSPPYYCLSKVKSYLISIRFCYNSCICLRDVFFLSCLLFVCWMAIIIALSLFSSQMSTINLDLIEKL